jgi:ABC-2 type transport system permease protein
VRSPAACLLGAALLTLVTAATLANDFGHDIAVGDRAPTDTLPAGQAVGPALLLGTTVFVAFAMLPVTAEYVTGSVRSTFLAQPRRRLVLAAKTAVVAGGGLVLGVVAGGVSAVVVRQVLGEHAAPGGTPGALALKAGALLALDAVLVAGLASVLRSPVGTLAAGVTVTTALLALPDRLNAWTPAGAALRLLSGDQGQYPAGHPTPVALAVLAAWSAVVYAIGCWLIEHRDA